MKGMFLKSPTVRMGSQNYMRGDSVELTSSTELAGVALLRVTMIGPGGGGGGMFRKEPEENFIAPKKADGAAGSHGQLRSNIFVSIRPDSNGYNQRSGGGGARATITSGGNGNADNGFAGTAVTLADMSCSGGSGGSGGWVHYPDSSSWNRTPSNVTNPDGTGNFAGRGGFGGDMNSYSSAPFYGSGTGQPSKAWVSILD